MDVRGALVVFRTIGLLATGKDGEAVISEMRDWPVPERRKVTRVIMRLTAAVIACFGMTEMATRAHGGATPDIASSPSSENSRSVMTDQSG